MNLFQMNISTLQRYWFLWSLLGILFIAYLKPSIGKSGGLIAPEYTIKYVSTFFLFLLTGYSIKSQVNFIYLSLKLNLTSIYSFFLIIFKDLQKILLSIKIHSFIQFFTYFIMPFIFLLFKFILLKFGFNRYLADG